MVAELPIAAESHCELLGEWGSFGWWLQGFLGVVSFGSLVGKRFTDKVRRPWKIWFFDTSKQVLQCCMIHLLNIGLASGFDEYLDEWLDVKADACSWYWINLTLDCTVGVLILFIFLRSLQSVYRTRCVDRPELARTGDYGAPPDWCIFTRQLLDWLLLAALQKLFLACVVVAYGQLLAQVARTVLGRLDAYPRAKLFVVMVLTPLTLNIFALWTADSFLQASSEDDDDTVGMASGVKPEKIRRGLSGLSEKEDATTPTWTSYKHWKFVNAKTPTDFLEV